MASPKPKKSEADDVRLVCTLENASTSISGIAFATITLDDGTTAHLSERLSAERAEALLGIPGFAVWEGDEALHARTIEDALDAARGTSMVPGSLGASNQIEQDLRRQITELQRANMAQAKDLADARRENTLLAEANRTLTAEIDGLKAAGVRAAA